MGNLSQRAAAAPELLTAMTGSRVSIGVLLYAPTIIIFDNQSTDAVEISLNSDPTWKTFTAGEALVLDLRAAHGLASNYAFPVGTEFFGEGPASGNFSISYLYAPDL